MKMHFKIIVLIALVICLPGCTMNPGTTKQTTENLSSASSPFIENTTETISQTTMNPQNEMDYKFDVSHNRILLLPASLDAYNMGKKTNESLFWELSEQQMQWNPVEYSVHKICSLTGRSWYDSEDSSYDVYQVIIGGWINYCLIQESQMLPIEQQILLDYFMNGQKFVPKCKDFWIIKVYDDLYSIDVQGDIQKISQRHVGGFDYETIEKQGIGDLFSWEWIGEWACSPQSNRIFYLTSREKSFYSIWCIDLDQKTESRFCQDIAYQMPGIGNQQLVVILEQKKAGDPFGKLISVTDPSQFSVIGDNEWVTGNGWLYRQDGARFTLQYQGKKIEIAMNIKDEFLPLKLSSDILWLGYNRNNGQNMDVLRIDLQNQVCSTDGLSKTSQFADYQMLLSDMKSSEMTYAQAADKGIIIIVNGS
jgi:hypothetical protein